MKKKLYIESSVWNQLVHTDRPDWREVTEDLVKTIKTGIYEVYISELVLEEINRTKALKVRKSLMENIKDINPKVLPFDEEARNLVDKYLKAKIIQSRKRKVIIDIGHVAIATVNGIRNILSYNFHHLVNEFNIDKFNGVNLQNQYDVILNIKSPHSFILRKDDGYD